MKGPFDNVFVFYFFSISNFFKKRRHLVMLPVVLKIIRNISHFIKTQWNNTK
ncbi:hypothetical protein IC575_024302 [Cucumis melo]